MVPYRRPTRRQALTAAYGVGRRLFRNRQWLMRRAGLVGRRRIPRNPYLRPQAVHHPYPPRVRHLRGGGTLATWHGSAHGDFSNNSNTMYNTGEIYSLFHVAKTDPISRGTDSGQRIGQSCHYKGLKYFIIMENNDRDNIIWVKLIWAVVKTIKYVDPVTSSVMINTHPSKSFFKGVEVGNDIDFDDLAEFGGPAVFGPDPNWTDPNNPAPTVQLQPDTTYKNIERLHHPYNPRKLNIKKIQTIKLMPSMKGQEAKRHTPIPGVSQPLVDLQYDSNINVKQQTVGFVANPTGRDCKALKGFLKLPMRLTFIDGSNAIHQDTPRLLMYICSNGNVTNSPPVKLHLKVWEYFSR